MKKLVYIPLMRKTDNYCIMNCLLAVYPFVDYQTVNRKRFANIFRYIRNYVIYISDSIRAITNVKRCITRAKRYIANTKCYTAIAKCNNANMKCNTAHAKSNTAFSTVSGLIFKKIK